MDRALGKLPPDELGRLGRHLEEHGPHDIGTMCSGTDSPLLVLQAISAALRTHSACGWAPAHSFSAEKDAKQREFLNQMFEGSLTRLFDDCTNFSEGACMCSLLGEVTPAPATGLLYAGFPCQDVSQANPSSKRRRADVCSGKLRTGIVFKYGVCNYIRQHSPYPLQAAILENVVGLARGFGDDHDDSDITSPTSPTPLDWVAQEISDLGQFFFVFQSDPRDFGFAVSRPRLWMIAIPASLFDGVMTRDEAQSLLQDYIDSSCSAGWAQPVCFEFVSLREDSLLLSRLRDECAQLPLVTCDALTHHRRGRAQRTTCMDLQMKHCEKHGVWDMRSSGIPGPDVQQMWPTLRQLSPTEFDLLRVKAKVSEFPEKSLRVVNVNDSIHRASCRSAGSGCMTVTTSARCYLTSRCRIMTGVEALTTQGIHYNDFQDRLQLFSDRMLLDLAGNAFHCWCCTAATLATLRLLCEVQHRRRQRQRDPMNLRRSTWTQCGPLSASKTQCPEGHNSGGACGVRRNGSAPGASS